MMLQAGNIWMKGGSPELSSMMILTQRKGSGPFGAEPSLLLREEDNHRAPEAWHILFLF